MRYEKILIEWFVCAVCNNYSGTSDKGPSEKRTKGHSSGSSLVPRLSNCVGGKESLVHTVVRMLYFSQKS